MIYFSTCVIHSVYTGLEFNFFFFLQNIASRLNTNSQNQKHSRNFLFNISHRNVYIIVRPFGFAYHVPIKHPAPVSHIIPITHSRQNML